MGRRPYLARLVQRAVGAGPSAGRGPRLEERSVEAQPAVPTAQPSARDNDQTRLPPLMPLPPPLAAVPASNVRSRTTEAAVRASPLRITAVDSHSAKMSLPHRGKMSTARENEDVAAAALEVPLHGALSSLGEPPPPGDEPGTPPDLETRVPGVPPEAADRGSVFEPPATASRARPHDWQLHRPELPRRETHRESNRVQPVVTIGEVRVEVIDAPPPATSERPSGRLEPSTARATREVLPRRALGLPQL